MLATAIIVFREVLEAALIVGIVLAATQGVPRRGAWVGARHRRRRARRGPGGRLCPDDRGGGCRRRPGGVQRRGAVRGGGDARLAQCLDDPPQPRADPVGQPARRRGAGRHAAALGAVLRGRAGGVARRLRGRAVPLRHRRRRRRRSGGAGDRRRARAAGRRRPPARRSISGWSASRCAICSR